MAAPLLAWALKGDSSKAGDVLSQCRHNTGFREVPHSSLWLSRSNDSTVDGYIVFPTISEWKRLDDFDGDSYERDSAYARRKRAGCPHICVEGGSRRFSRWGLDFWIFWDWEAFRLARALRWNGTCRLTDILHCLGSGRTRSLHQAPLLLGCRRSWYGERRQHWYLLHTALEVWTDPPFTCVWSFLEYDPSENYQLPLT